MIHFIYIILFMLAGSFNECPKQLGNVPVFYEGKIRPFDSFARLWMQSVYNRLELLPEHRQFFSSSIKSPVDFLWSLNSFDAGKIPMFWVGEKELKKLLQLSDSKDRFCFDELRPVFEDLLLINLQVIEQIILASFFKISEGMSFYPGQKLNLNIFNAEIECLCFEHKIVIISAPPLIPWHYLSSICRSSPYTIEIHSPQTAAPWIKSLQSLLNHFLQFKELQLSKSFLNSLFYSPFAQSKRDDPSLKELSSAYDSIFFALDQGDSIHRLSDALNQFFTLYQAALRNDSFSYPTLFQLKTEKSFVQHPIIELTAAFYTLSLLCFFFCSIKNIRKRIRKSTLKFVTKLALTVLGIGFVLHSGALLFKAFVFAYPPLSTLFDSAFFVAWLSILVAFLFFMMFKVKIPIVGSLIFAEGIFSFLYALNVHDPFAVDQMSNSTFPSFTVTLGYGILFMGGILAHFALAALLQGKKEMSPLLSRCIVINLYLGIFFLVIGLLLENLLIKPGWDNFWSIKEIWIEISICFYLALIHLNHFKWVDPFITALGLCFGSILLSVAAYGSNFFLETSWHFYREHKEALLYLVYIFFEIVFIAIVLIRKKRCFRERMLNV